MAIPPRAPPRFVPTLTDVVRATPPSAGLRVTPAMPDAMAASRLEELMVQRIMERVELSLERRLREATAKLVLEQTRTLGPALRREIEAVVRQTVVQAVAEERSLHGDPPAAG